MVSAGIPVLPPGRPTSHMTYGKVHWFVTEEPHPYLKPTPHAFRQSPSQGKVTKEKEPDCIAENIEVRQNGSMDGDSENAPWQQFSCVAFGFPRRSLCLCSFLSC